MCEIKNVINSRLITLLISDDVRDQQPLTPNILLNMKRQQSLPPGSHEPIGLYSRKRWKLLQCLANTFWKRWVKEYLLLQKCHKWTHAYRNFNIGNVVIIVDSNLPRNAWSKGVILETRTDKCGFARSAKIKTAAELFERPITKLCLLSLVEEVN